MATKKLWITYCLEDLGSYQKTYETVDSAVIAAKQRTAKNGTQEIGVFELVKVTTPIVPDIQVADVK